MISTEISALDSTLREENKRLETIPSVGPVIASALTARVTDPALFKNGRHLSQETIYFLGFTLYCACNRKSNFKVGLAYGAAFCLCRS
jgi:hypothetical protein